MNVRIRSARANELDDVGRLTVAAYAADGVVTPDHPYAEHLADTPERYRHALLLVAAEGDRLLGTVTVVSSDSPLVEMCRPGEVEVRMLAVDPAARGRGVGELLARACVDAAREQGSERVVLSSGTWMGVAHRLYERLGFVRVPERDWSPRSDVHLLAFELPLTG